MSHESIAPFSGWINLYKPEGITSAFVLRKIERLFKGVKIGHGGTLDPMATGVLPVALGEATKLLTLLLDAKKGYDFEITFGSSTTTDDAQGEVLDICPKRPSRQEIEKALEQFRGSIEQLPPTVCALKINGKRAYQLVKAGKPVELKKRPVTIYELELIDYTPDKAQFKVLCSKGTYVRSLARDLAAQLSTLGHISALKRTKSGPFCIESSIPLESFTTLCHSEEACNKVLRVGVVLDDIPAISVSQEEAWKLRCGQAVETDHPDAEHLVAVCGEELIAIVGCENNILLTKRGFQKELYR